MATLRGTFDLPISEWKVAGTGFQTTGKKGNLDSVEVKIAGKAITISPTTDGLHSWTETQGELEDVYKLVRDFLKAPEIKEVDPQIIGVSLREQFYCRTRRLAGYYRNYQPTCDCHQGAVKTEAYLSEEHRNHYRLRISACCVLTAFALQFSIRTGRINPSQCWDKPGPKTPAKASS